MRHILIVEDSKTQAEQLRLLLSREGYEIELAHTGEEALRKTETRIPGLIISDVTMPGMDGFVLCQMIKSSEATLRVPVILLTSRTSPMDIIKGLESGADNFIPKPYDDDYLLGRVARIIEQLELRKDESLDMEVVLTVGGRKIRVTADRQQIVELLFSTFEQMSKNFDQLAQANHELQEARIQAERANRAKSQFLSRMSHELRTPLNSINGFAQLLEMSELAPKDLENVRMIGTAGHHLLVLINELLDIGRIEADELGLLLEPVRVADVHEETVHLIGPLAAERGISVEDGAGSPDLHVVADGQRLKQVLLNLLSNAVKYNHEGGTVRFGWAAVGDRVRIEVADTGVGIAEESLERLFVPFDRIDAEGTGVEGTGLGLTVSKRLVEVMAGRLTVESEVGVGSTFSVELPRAHIDGAKGNEEASPEAALQSKPLDRETTILYIEDDFSSFRLVEQVLQQRLGVTPLHAARGRDGLDLARRYPPKIILLDFNLPDMSGHEVLSILKADRSTEDTPVIMLSADVSPNLMETLREAGASDYLKKPIDVHRLVRVVETLLQHSMASAETETVAQTTTSRASDGRWPSTPEQE
jgi:signal transduction histidine kinase